MYLIRNLAFQQMPPYCLRITLPWKKGEFAGLQNPTSGTAKYKPRPPCHHGGTTQVQPMIKLIACFLQGSYRSLECLKVLEIHHWFFKALKSLKNSTFLVKVLKSP